jgi:UMF1 family MFS transporter
MDSLHANDKKRKAPGVWGKLGVSTPALRAWALYDCGNSAFSLAIVTAIFPTYYADVAADKLEPYLRTAYFGYSSSLAMLIGVLLGPPLGALSDMLGFKKKLVGIFTLLGVIATALMFFISEGDWVLALALFMIGNIGYSLSEQAYESILGQIASDEEVNRASSAGYAIGYFGSGLLLVALLAMILKPELFMIADKGLAVKLGFVIVALWWIIFTLPLLFKVPEPISNKRQQISSVRAIIFESFNSVYTTLREIRHFKDAFLFLLAFFLYSDGVNTIIKMATIYGREVGIATDQLILAILAVQFVAVPATILFGTFADRLGVKRGINISLGVYLLITIMGYFMSQAWHFWVLAITIGIVQGPVQALSRSLFIRLIPLKRSGEFFGFYGLGARFTGLFGPLIFALITQFTGNSRLSILAIVILFLLGMILLKHVDPERARRALAE